MLSNHGLDSDAREAVKSDVDLSYARRRILFHGMRFSGSQNLSIRKTAP